MDLLAIALLNHRNRWIDSEIARLTESALHKAPNSPAACFIEGSLLMLNGWKDANNLIITRLEEVMSKQEQEA
jgi:hypothetical protein